jgi:uncharacterized protein (TIGR02452 family)
MEIPKMLATEWKDNTSPVGKKFKYTEIPTPMTVDEDSVNRERKWIHLVRCDSVEAVGLAKSNNPGAQVVVFTLADEKNAGGLLYKGSCLQEESLCVQSTLYDSLNNACNYPILEDEMIDSSNVICFDTVAGRGLKSGAQTRTFDIVSCPAMRNPGVIKADGPNPAQYVEDGEVFQGTMDKLRHVMHLAVANKRDTVVLGLFGCRGFKHPSHLVASITKSVLTLNVDDWRASGIEDVVNAILDRKPELPVWSAWVKEFVQDQMLRSSIASTPWKAFMGSSEFTHLCPVDSQHDRPCDIIRASISPTGGREAERDLWRRPKGKFDKQVGAMNGQRRFIYLCTSLINSHSLRGS